MILLFLNMVINNKEFKEIISNKVVSKLIRTHNDKQINELIELLKKKSVILLKTILMELVM